MSRHTGHHFRTGLLNCANFYCSIPRNSRWKAMEQRHNIKPCSNREKRRPKPMRCWCNCESRIQLVGRSGHKRRSSEGFKVITVCGRRRGSKLCDGHSENNYTWRLLERFSGAIRNLSEVCCICLRVLYVILKVISNVHSVFKCLSFHSPSVLDTPHIVLRC